MMDARTAYGTLERRFERVAGLRSIRGQLDWDSAVMLPPAAGAARARQMGLVEEMLGETLRAPDMPELLDAALRADLDPWQIANLREMRAEIGLARATPPDLAARAASAHASCELAWRTAKAQSDFALVRNALEDVFAIARNIAVAAGAVLGLDPYDAVMARWEPGARSRSLAVSFDELAQDLGPLAQDIAARQTGPKAACAAARFTIGEQAAAARPIAALLGYDGRLDPCAHAFFSDDNPDDLRIGLALREGPVLPVLSGLIHEIGHAHYERNVPQAWRGQPVGRPRSAAFQESQALFYENIIGRSDAFWRRVGAGLRATLGVDGDSWSDAALAQARRIVAPGPLRVGSDEVSYALHIVLRFRLERALLTGTLAVADLPDAWAAQSQSLFGFAPANDAQGCLQDIHWYRGLLGYFPSYALGQMLAAQFAAAAEADIQELWDGEGRFDLLADWLRAHIHRWGSFHTGEALTVAATGEALSAKPLLRHLARRYGVAARSTTTSV